MIYVKKKKSLGLKDIQLQVTCNTVQVTSKMIDIKRLIYLLYKNGLYILAGNTTTSLFYRSILLIFSSSVYTK